MKKSQLKDDRQNGETDLDEEIDEAQRKKTDSSNLKKKYHELKDMRTRLPITINARSTPIRLV